MLRAQWNNILQNEKDIYVLELFFTKIQIQIQLLATKGIDAMLHGPCKFSVGL